ncbi:hypothetical protein [Blautia hydrogenotrophica]|uniref:Uncharacterized protein n=1 Tax=Blautia hydrogenotrophica (strain DSM 10507 / JCM 14656 / S5a33) TaxID=476272 RepID=C0CPM4_BLAHS|nr:hypothetical protein [Blautia hydrogenotrophica]EEG48285.1 hypothetical protein RUMHYD_02825 [Blautia hydrogenotrophica DSM 10507]MCT6797473.1 hypothetical protein [Blautia hydrogenotrophica]WPX84566.1 hypothetical protein BLHYD_25830 [Blautia hydrogenotrophica DSM 10507]
MTIQDVNVVLMDFPNTKEKELVTPNDDGSYTIFINSRFNYETQLKAYIHAIQHIEAGDFEKENVQEIEMIAHTPEISPKAKVIPANKFEDRIKRLRRQRRRDQRKMKERQKAIEFIQKYESADYFFRVAENHKLYGDDL